MKAGGLYKTTVETLSSQGLGICRIDGLTVFVDGACPGDILNIKITKVNKSFANADIVEILEPSEFRVKPFCPLQKVCGACQLQYIDYDFQLKLKKRITEDAMHKIGHIETQINNTIPSPLIKNYRCKIQYPVSRTKNSQRMLAGYYKPKTHEIVNIKYCPVQPEICDKIIDFIREKSFDYGIKGYIEKNHSGDLRHVIIRHSNYNGKNLVVLVANATKTFDRLNDFANAIYEEFKEVSGVCVNYNPKDTNVITGRKTECICGTDYIEEKILGKTFKIGADTFFQINPQSAENIFKYVKDYLSGNFTSPVVLDAYAGITAFGIAVSDVCKKVVSVEDNSASCIMAQEALKINKIKNVEINNADAGKFLVKEKREFDVVILDPPRKGCTEQSLDDAFRLAKSAIVYVSCNPATLARDLKYLTEKGAKVESIQPFDMFCHTYHVENAAIIKI